VPVNPSHRLTGGAAMLAGGVAVASLAFASLPANASVAASATPNPHTTSARSLPPAAAAASYLVGRLGGKHHNHYTSSFTSGGKTTTYVNYGETIDAALSMDAAGVAQGAVKRVTTYLENHVAGYAGTAKTGYLPGQIGKLMLIAEAQHAPLKSFGGANLPAELKSTEGLGDAKTGEYQQNPTGTPPDFEYFSTTSQALAMLGLADSATGSAQPDHAAKSFLKAQQCANGGFPTQLLADRKTACKAGSDIDSTGYAVQALLASGNIAAADRGVRYLLKVQHSGGGFGPHGGNANSTALAVEALAAAHKSLGGAVTWLQHHQVGCSGRAGRRGAVNFQQGYDAAASLLATSQAGTALARSPLATIDRKGAVKATPKIRC
jgi:hypothetical protein